MVGIFFGGEEEEEVVVVCFATPANLENYTFKDTTMAKM